jgi:hypothetical protein
VAVERQPVSREVLTVARWVLQPIAWALAALSSSAVRKI